MKFVLVIVAVVVLFLLLRGTLRNLKGTGRAPPRQAPPEEAPRGMLACAHCGMYLPKDEALPGRGGVFCGEAHRAAHERSHPAS